MIYGHQTTETLHASQVTQKTISVRRRLVIRNYYIIAAYMHGAHSSCLIKLGPITVHVSVICHISDPFAHLLPSLSCQLWRHEDHVSHFGKRKPHCYSFSTFCHLFLLLWTFFPEKGISTGCRSGEWIENWFKSDFGEKLRTFGRNMTFPATILRSDHRFAKTNPKNNTFVASRCFTTASW